MIAGQSVAERDAMLPEGSAQLEKEVWAETNPTPVLRSVEPPPKVSAQTSPIGRAESKVRFRTAREIAQETPEDVEWLVARFVAFGALTEFVGKVKVGKTDLILAACRASLTGGRFLGEPTGNPGGIVYLTEQTPASLRQSLRRADLLERDDFLVLSWADARGLSWPAIVEEAEAAMVEREFGCLVVDTLSRFAGIRGDGENSAGDADAAMAPLQTVASHGHAVIVLRHERKSGGDVGDSGRGSSAFSGSVDVALALRRGEGRSRPTIRVLHGLSRFDETPDTLVIERTDAGYVSLGDESQVAFVEARRAIEDELPADDGPTLKELQTRLDRFPRTTLQRAVDDLIVTGSAWRVGSGKRGDPFRFVSAQPPDVWAESYEPVDDDPSWPPPPPDDIDPPSAFDEVTT